METIHASGRVNTDEAQKDFIRINEAGEGFLKTAAKWGQFIAVICFIAAGLMAVISLSMIILSTPLQEYQDFSGYPVNMLGFVYLISAAVSFLPAYFLLRACSRLKKAFAERDENILSNAFQNLKNLSLFIGIMYVVSIVFILLILVWVVFFAGLLSVLAA